MHRLLPKPSTLDPRLRERIKTPGRVRNFFGELASHVFTHPNDAGDIIHRELRHARFLHSHERRFVADHIYALIRHYRVVALATSSETPLHWSQAWLDFQAGLRNLEVDIPANPKEAFTLFSCLEKTISDALYDSLEDPIAFLAASNVRAGFFLRTNVARISRDLLQQRLLEEGVLAKPHPLHHAALSCEERWNVSASPSFREGLFEVQDVGSQWVGSKIPSGQHLFDLCAGAGGKTLQIAAELQPPRLTAADVRLSALEELRKRSFQAKARNIETFVIDAYGNNLPKRSFDPDVIIIDAPCTGLGTLRRHPELRLRLTKKELESLQKTQNHLLHFSSRLSSATQNLFYITCSVLKAENDDRINHFLKTNPAWGLHSLGHIQPDTHSCDGFFYAHLRRQPNASPLDGQHPNQ